MLEDFSQSSYSSIKNQDEEDLVARGQQRVPSTYPAHLAWAAAAGPQGCPQPRPPFLLPIYLSPRPNTNLPL
eukprot:2430355-Pleurochrysis_carterae.AAC.1